MLLGTNRVLVLLCVAVGIFAYPMAFRNNPYLIHIGTVALLYAIMAVGLNVTVGFAGLVDLGFAAFYAVGAYSCAILTTSMTAPFWVAVPVAALSASCIGLVIGAPALKVRDHYLALVTLGFGHIIYLLANNLESFTGGTNGISEIPAPALLGHTFRSDLQVFTLSLPFQANYFYLATVLLGFGVAATAALRTSRVGRCMAAVREDELAANCFGVSPTRLKLLAFAFSAAFGGVSGAIYASMVGYIDPDNFTFAVSLTLLCIVIFGGKGNIAAVVVAAIAMIMLPEKLREFERLRMLLYGLCLLGMVLYRPDGLWPAKGRARGNL